MQVGRSYPSTRDAVLLNGAFVLSFLAPLHGGQELLRQRAMKELQQEVGHLLYQWTFLLWLSGIPGCDVFPIVMRVESP